MSRFVKFKDPQGEDCFVNVDLIRAVRAAVSPRRGGSNIVFDSGSILEVQESPERVVCRCQNAGQVKPMESSAY